MKSCEDLVAPVSDYFIYSRSAWRRKCFCIRCNAVCFPICRDILSPENPLTAFF